MDNLSPQQLSWLADWTREARGKLPFDVMLHAPYHRTGNFDVSDTLDAIHSEGGWLHNELSTLVRKYERAGRWSKKTKPVLLFWLAGWLEAGEASALAAMRARSQSPSLTAGCHPTDAPMDIAAILAANWAGLAGREWVEANSEYLLRDESY